MIQYMNDEWKDLEGMRSERRALTWLGLVLLDAPGPARIRLYVRERSPYRLVIRQLPLPLASMFKNGVEPLWQSCQWALHCCPELEEDCPRDVAFQASFSG